MSRRGDQAHIALPFLHGCGTSAGTPMAITRETILEVAGSLPPASQVFAELGGLLRRPDSSLEDIATLIKRDGTLAAHLIRISNSVAYGGQRKVGSVEEALARVGLQEVFRLVSQVASTQLIDRTLGNYGIEAEELRAQMLQTAFICEHLADECGLDSRSAYTVGLVRPIGLLVLDRLAERYRMEPYHPIHDPDFLTWEGRVFGIASPEVAAMVLTQWSFREDIVEAVRNQYLLRSEDTQDRLACLLNLSGGLVADAGHALLGETRHWGLTPGKLQALGVTDEALRAAGRRAFRAFAAFQNRLANRVEVDEPAKAAVLEAQPNGRRTTQPAQGACNFPGDGRVVQSNDELPVQTPPTGLINPTDFTTFMRNYQDMVFSTAVRLVGNEAQAEDISQEVFLKAYERYDSLQSSPTAGGWLKTVATNLSLNHLSRYRNRWRFFSEFRRNDDSADEDQPEVEFAAPDTFFTGVDAGERREWVEQALEKLPEHQRVPLVLYHFEDMSYEDIAKRLRISLAKVKTDILRARNALARILERSGAPHEKFSA